MVQSQLSNYNIKIFLQVTYILFVDLSWKISKEKEACIKAMPIKADATGEETSTYDDDCVEPIDFSSIKQGMFVAVDKEEWSNRPQIGRVEEILKDAVYIIWLHGTYISVFEDCYTSENGPRDLWKGRISFCNIVMTNVQFTKNNRLRKENREELRLRYELYDTVK